MLTCLLILSVTFFGLTIYSVAQANMSLLPAKATRFLSLKVLDTSAAATLFVTVLGALLVRHQFALGVLPRINYKSTIATKQNPLHPGEILETWRVEIRNTGLGSAIINRTEYILESGNVRGDFSSCGLSDVILELAKICLVRNEDYWLENITPGFSLSPKDDCFVFEIKREHIEKLKRLNMVLHFQGQLGDKYCRDISLIPRI